MNVEHSQFSAAHDINTVPQYALGEIVGVLIRVQIQDITLESFKCTRHISMSKFLISPLRGGTQPLVLDFYNSRRTYPIPSAPPLLDQFMVDVRTIEQEHID